MQRDDWPHTGPLCSGPGVAVFCAILGEFLLLVCSVLQFVGTAYVYLESIVVWQYPASDAR